MEIIILLLRYDHRISIKFWTLYFNEEYKTQMQMEKY